MGGVYILGVVNIVGREVRLVRLHATPQDRNQKQCNLVRKFVWIWSALQLPYNHIWHQSTAKAKRYQLLRSGAAVAQNQLQKPWWHFILTDQILWWQGCMFRVYSKNSFLKRLCIWQILHLIQFIGVKVCKHHTSVTTGSRKCPTWRLRYQLT